MTNFLAMYLWEMEDAGYRDPESDWDDAPAQDQGNSGSDSGDTSNAGE